MSQANVVQDEALKEAVMRDELDAARAALQAGADVNGWMPVHQCMLLGAAANGSDTMIDLLLEYGANPLATDRDGKNVYHKLAEGMPLDDARRACAVRRLKHVGPNPDDPSEKWSDAALHLAAERDMPEVCHALVVDCGADVDVTNNAGETPVHVAVGANREAALHDLLLLGASLEYEDGRGLTPLTLADEEANAAVKTVLRRYMDWPVPDVTQANLADDPSLLQNPKFWQQAEQALAALEQQGTPLSRARLSAANPEGGTPLHLAWRCGKLGVALEHMQAHEGRITAAELRDAEGKQTPLCKLLVEAEAAASLFREAQWQDAEPDELRATYAALPPHAQEHVPNYRQLLHRVEIQQNQQARGR